MMGESGKESYSIEVPEILKDEGLCLKQKEQFTALIGTIVCHQNVGLSWRSILVLNDWIQEFCDSLTKQLVGAIWEAFPKYFTVPERRHAASHPQQDQAWGDLHLP